MAGRNLPSNRVFTNVPEAFPIFIKCTFAADAEANGVTINLGAGYLDATTPVTRTAEGKFKFNFRDKWKRLVGFHWIGTTENSDIRLVEDDVDGSSPFVHLLWEASSTGTDTDPDSGVFYLTFYLQNSGQSY